MKRRFPFFLLLSLSFFAKGQQQLEFGLLVGQSNYLGDLVEPSFTLAHGSFSGGAFLRYPLLKDINLRSNLIVGKLVGDDANYSTSLDRGASFETSFIEAAVLGEYELKGLFPQKVDAKKKSKRNTQSLSDKISPFVFLGLGASIIDPKPKFRTATPQTSADLNGDYSDFQAVVPLGFGVNYKASDYLKIGLEFSTRFAFTDYIDGVSLAGNPSNNDSYNTLALTASYQIGLMDADLDGIADKDDKCPKLPGPLRLNGCPDSDKDGITDDEDECPTEAGRASLNGCPDSDNDGVPDILDDCPDDKGIRRLGGCPDSDNDGIVDPEDICPNEAGIPSLNGCPDKDRDGITDSKDRCPLERGLVHLNGCPDSDDDGIIDQEDECPREPGRKQDKGCPKSNVDSDKDGVMDTEDLCPEVPGNVSNNGCPEVKKEDKEILDFAMSNVQFQTGSDELTLESQRILDQIVDVMKRYKGYRLRINGHTDNVGDPSENLELSEFRARACYDYLFIQGINPTVLSYNGYGETQPIADNKTEEGRRKNRRVEFILTTERE